MEMSKDQIDAKNKILDWLKSKNRSSYMTLGGFAGTGKSSLIAEVRKSLPKMWKVAFCAFTGKAASVLKGKLDAVNAIHSDDYIGTIHGLCYRVREDPETLLNVFERRWDVHYDLIVVDEASMVTKELFSDLRSFRIPILFVGDHGQLPPISSDGFNLMEKPDIRLEEVHRFSTDSALLDLSVLARSGDKIPIKDFSDKVFKTTERDRRVDEFIINRLSDFSNGVCLCATNNTRVDVNQLMRKHLGLISDLSDKVPRVSDRVVCLRNNHGLANPIYNGMLGSVVAVHDAPGIIENAYNMRIVMDEGFKYCGMASKETFCRMKASMEQKVKEFVTFRELMELKDNLTIAEKKKIRKLGKKKIYFDQFDFGYCLTVHKSQGSEWGNVLLFEESCGQWDDETARRWMYTAVTRSNDRLLIVC